MAYQPPPSGAFTPGPERASSSLSWIALGLGVASLVLCCVWGGFWLGIPAIVVGGIGLTRGSRNRWAAFTGIALGAFTLLLTLFVLAVYGAMGWFHMDWEQMPWWEEPDDD